MRSNAMNDIAKELALLHELQGADFVRQLERITSDKRFYSIENETAIFAMGDYQQEDLPSILDAARKAVAFGYRVYLLPNPNNVRTADFIFVRNNIYKMYDLKTIRGKASVLNRLTESIGQTRHVLLNMTTDYNPRLLAKEIHTYFEKNPAGCEVLIFKHKKLISVTRKTLEDKNFVKTFMHSYMK